MNTTAQFKEIRRTLMHTQHDVYDMLLDLRVATGSTEVRDLANEVWDAMEAIRRKVYEVQVAHERKNDAE